MPDRLPTHLVVSPHFDDAVLSRGPLMSTWRRMGHTVLSANVFTGGPGGDDSVLSPAAQADRQRYPADPLTIRSDEDDRAAQTLGFTAVNLGLPEVLYRWRSDGRPRVAGLSDIFGPVEADDAAVISVVSETLVSVIDRSNADWIHVPFGIGKHIDHAIARKGAQDAARHCGPPVRLAYYQDLPYALDENEFSANADLGMPAEGLLHLQRPWRVDNEDIDNWIAAIACYATQVDIMFRGRNWQNDFRSWAMNNNTEKVWVAS